MHGFHYCDVGDMSLTYQYQQADNMKATCDIDVADISEMSGHLADISQIAKAAALPPLTPTTLRLLGGTMLAWP